MKKSILIGISILPAIHLAAVEGFVDTRTCLMHSQNGISLKHSKL